jgi:hypothetical protein
MIVKPSMHTLTAFAKTISRENNKWGIGDARCDNPYISHTQATKA